MKAFYKKYILKFKIPGGTSRGILKTKETFFLIINYGDKRGIGECGLFRGLSFDDRPDYEEMLQWVCDNISKGKDWLLKELFEFPSIQFGIEQAFLSLESKELFELFPSQFIRGNDAIEINGLIWMGDKAFMKSQIIDKINAGFTTVKMKIGAIDFQTELSLLKFIRQEFSEKDIELRVDANGAFKPDEALEKLKRLSEYKLHSIEQPIRQGQWQEMARLCEKTPLSIALDEDLIGIINFSNKEKLIETIKPQYIILKPSLVGGFQGSNEWIKTAKRHSVCWWITSALESNVGLNAIAQYAYNLNVTMPQGLGTGSLFTNNFDSPLFVDAGLLQYNPEIEWNFNL